MIYHENFFLPGHLDGSHGSPFPTSQGMASPVASNWPNSPGMPRPSPARPGQSPDMWQQQQHQQQQPLQPQPRSRSWAAQPTVVSYQSLDLLCRPCPTPAPGPNVPPSLSPPGALELCPLERFLGCVFMRRQMHRFIQSEDMVRVLNTGRNLEVNLSFHYFKGVIIL